MADWSLRLGRTLLHAIAGCGLTLATVRAQGAPAFDHGHAAWSAVLKECVKGDGFDYAHLAADRRGLTAYLDALHAVTPAELAAWSEPQRFAFWINAYNAHVVERVLERYPVKSINELDTRAAKVFDQAFIPMRALHPEEAEGPGGPGGKDEPLSLNDIENGILRPRFHDARLHAAINCAARSCPPLRGEAFVAERLSDQLDQQMRAFLADASRNRIDPEKQELRLSRVFEWFAADFEREGGVSAFVARFVPAARADFVRATKPAFLEYDWALNDAR